MLAELEIEERTERLGEELNRRSAEAHAPRLRAVLRRLGRQPGRAPAPARDAEEAGRWFAGGTP